jgi:hypothetical protein
MPCLYDLILKRAHSRVFNLAQRIKASAPVVPRDEEMEDVLNEATLEDMFSAPNASDTSLRI